MIRAGMFHHLYLHSAKLCPRLPVEINPGPDERCQQVGQDKQIQFQCVKQLTKQEGLRFLASFNYLIAPSKITPPICFLSNGLAYLQSNSCLYRRCFPFCWGWLSRVSTATKHGRSATIKRCSRQYRVVANANAWVISHGPQQRFEKSVKLNSPYFFYTLMTLLEHMEKTAWNVKWMVWHTLLHYLFSKIDRKPDRPRQNLAPRILHLLAHDGLLATWEVKSNSASRNVSILMLLGMLYSRCLPLNEKISG